jgi:hypothetical protein
VVRGVEFCTYACLREAVNTYHRYEEYVLNDYRQQERISTNLVTHSAEFLMV